MNPIDDAEVDMQSMVRLNSFVELKFFVLTLIYQHSYGKTDDHVS